MNPSTLRSRMRKYGIRRPGSRPIEILAAPRDVAWEQDGRLAPPDSPNRESILRVPLVRTPRRIVTSAPAYSERIRISTRRFWNLPFSVELSAIGSALPRPEVWILAPSMPCLTR